MTAQQYTYLDPEGFRDYSIRDEWEICMEKHIFASADEVWEAWFTALWEGPGRPPLLNPGEGEGRLGSARTVRIAGAGMTEQIVSVGLPSPASQPEAVSSISYSLEHFSASTYLGYVRFFSTGPEGRTTRIVWCVKWTPTLTGRLFFGGHLLVRMLKSAIRQAFDDLEQEVTAR